MNKRKNEALNQYLLDEKEFKIFISLKKRLEEYLEVLNYLYEIKKIKYTMIIIKSSEKSIKETLNYIRKTDIFLKIPYTQNHYIIILQNTECKSAVQFGSRLTSLINRTFMLNKKNITHKVSLISFEKIPPKSIDVCYEIIHILKKFKEKSSDDYWVEIKRF
ncbi:hypothetical protein NAMH_1255 [Nautilia profundicola AmH]|uniref:Uncharacterized protein n=1 Tax=Nautilia profundicola (strain ATCC BAA-1463 / DSM 18972 / AmH) TaxID=598659 RepID=B9L5L0_NAUPA|nr:hypothetical protein [Nautilia profundicola]ACM92461.1 hypothetical protein NAMH_1255 [Nautilia profundicola AmH]